MFDENENVYFKLHLFLLDGTMYYDVWCWSGCYMYCYIHVLLMLQVVYYLNTCHGITTVVLLIMGTVVEAGPISGHSRFGRDLGGVTIVVLLFCQLDPLHPLRTPNMSQEHSSERQTP